jgi:hypothetical protein
MHGKRQVRITVCGKLSAQLAPAFEGMTLVGRGRSTDLVGEIADQAQLHALLARIRDLGLELESLESVPDHREREEA